LENNKRRKKERKIMKKKNPTAEEIAEMADNGEDITSYLEPGQKGYAAKLREKWIQRTNIDFGLDMLSQLDLVASSLNISRQAMVKLATQDYLTRYFLSQKAFKRVAQKSKSKK
jgi:hypothetical protein